MIGIYCIENKITHKRYIGQSTEIKNRWTRHRNDAHNSNLNYPLYQDMRLYGVDNFIFAVLEECSPSLLNEREKFWIKYYHTTEKDFGYNISFGGNGEQKTVGSKLTIETVREIRRLLKETKISQTSIADTFNCSLQNICAINNGRAWFDELETYPLRKKNTQSNKYVLEENKKLQLIRCIYAYGFTKTSKIFNTTYKIIIRICKENKIPATKRDFDSWFRDNWLIKKNTVSGKSTAVSQIDIMTGKILNNFSSCSEASRSLKGDSSLAEKINNAASGKAKTCYGYFWRYLKLPA